MQPWVATGLLVLLVGCASPARELWPPEKGAPTHTIIVSLDTWHAMIAFPINGPDAAGPSTEPGVSSSSTQHSSLSTRHFEEWGYAEQAWYLEGRQGFSGVIRALFWPTPGVVEVGRHDQVWADRTPQPPAERFTFHLSEQGYLRLLRYLHSSIAAPEPVLTAGTTAFYPAARSYHLFHHCHQYGAHGLREAGLPVAPAWALSRSLFAAQLRRAERMEAEIIAGREPKQTLLDPPFTTASRFAESKADTGY